MKRTSSLVSRSRSVGSDPGATTKKSYRLVLSFIAVGAALPASQFATWAVVAWVVWGFIVVLTEPVAKQRMFRVG